MAAMLAVSSEPLRESTQLRLIEAHIAEGNWVEGRRRFEAYRRLLRSVSSVPSLIHACPTSSTTTWQRQRFCAQRAQNRIRNADTTVGPRRSAGHIAAPISQKHPSLGITVSHWSISRLWHYAHA